MTSSSVAGPRRSPTAIPIRIDPLPPTQAERLDALLVAIIGADVEALCERGRELLDHPSPGEALTTWLRAVAVHATAMRGLVATRMAAQAAQPPRTTDAADTKAADGTLAACHDAILAAGGALLDRARRAGEANDATGIADLLTLVNAAAWASEQAPEDEHLLDRLLALITGGLK